MAQRRAEQWRICQLRFSNHAQPVLLVAKIAQPAEVEAEATRVLDAQEAGKACIEAVKAGMLILRAMPALAEMSSAFTTSRPW
jgi:hypothetical protein